MADVSLSQKQLQISLTKAKIKLPLLCPNLQTQFPRSRPNSNSSPPHPTPPAPSFTKASSLTSRASAAAPPPPSPTPKSEAATKSLTLKKTTKKPLRHPSSTTDRTHRRCLGSLPLSISLKTLTGPTKTYDLLNSNESNFNVSIGYNSSNENNSGGHFEICWVPRLVNLVTNAYLKYLRGPGTKILFEFVKEMPKPETPRWMSEFAFVLAPPLLTWVILQLFFAGVWIGRKYVFAEQRSCFSDTSVSGRREIQGHCSQVGERVRVLLQYEVF